MDKLEYVKEQTKKKYDEYPILIPYSKLPWSGNIIEVTLNDGTIDTVDQLTEFALCKASASYFIDRYCFTNHPKEGFVPFKLFDFQKEFLRDFQIYNKVIFKKSRQVGASVATGAYALWRANFNKSQQIRVISLTREDAIEFKDKTIDMNYEKMPGFLKTKIKGGRASRQKFELLNGSIIKVLSKSKNAARGSTPSLVIIDEAAFNEWMDDMWKAIEPALDKGGDIIVISTTNGVGNWYHHTYTQAEQKLNSFHNIFIPWWRYPNRSNPWLAEVMQKKKSKEWSEQDVEIFIKLKEKEQLAYTGDLMKAPWLKLRRSNAKSDREFSQEILADFLGSGATVIPFAKIIEFQSDWVIPPLLKDQLPNGSVIEGLWIWKPVTSDGLYMLTSDTSTGNGQDFSTMEIIDVYRKEQVAEYKGLCATDKMGELIKKIARYYNDAFVVIECNHPGPAVFNEVYKHKTDPYLNCYVKMKQSGPWSWDTTMKSRVNLIDGFFKEVMNNSTRFYSSRLVNEITTFIWSEQGKAEAARGNNDDLIISWAMYSHLVDLCFSSRPTSIHTSSGKVNPTQRTSEYDRDWEEYEDDFESSHNMSVADWHWLQDIPLPRNYIKWKEDQLRGVPEKEEEEQIAARNQEDEIEKEKYDFLKSQLLSLTGGDDE
jgi:hypothetical protein